MVGFMLSMLVGWFFYSRSKYYPGISPEIFRKMSPWIALLPIVGAGWVYFSQWDWAVGILLFLTVMPLGYAVIILLMNTKRTYTLFLSALLFVLFILDLLY